MRGVRVGILVESSAVRVVLVRARRLAGAACGETGGDELAGVLDELLRGFNLSRFPEPRAVLVLGPSRSQVRPLSGLPASSNPRVLAEVIADDPFRFFVGSGVPMLLTGVRPEMEGEVWASALAAGDVREVEQACRAHGIRLEAAVALPVALAHIAGDGEYVHVDGPVAAEFVVSGSRLAAVRRRPATGLAAALPPVPPLLGPLGEEAASYTGAYAGTRLSRHEPLALRLAPGDPPRWRLALASAALISVTLLSAWLPAKRTLDATRSATTELHRNAGARNAASREARELADVTRALRQVTEFADGRRSAVSLIAGLGSALPDGSALVSVKVDSAGGTIVLLAPRAAQALAQIGRVRGIGRPAITGGVTRETVDGRVLERVAVRFIWDGVARSSAGGNAP